MTANSSSSVVEFDQERETTEGRQDYRNRYQVDRDRLLYATDFARLAEITQVVPAEQGYAFHNRLTHSLKVAQIARRISEKLLKSETALISAAGGLDEDAAEAAGLAHDMGHPPFGHVAEEELNRLCRSKGLEDGFEGNAQSFRLVCSLSVSDAADSNSGVVRGLNLTRKSLNGILKYPWFYGENPNKMKKWGAYSTERETFHWVRKDFSFGTQIKSLEAEIMDWADDITYAVHDVIDFFCAGKIPLERLSSEDDDDGENERAFFLKWVFEHLKIKPEDQEELSKAFQEIIEIFPLEKKYMGTTEERWRLWQLITNLISRYVDAIHVVKPPHNGDPLVWFEPNAKAEVTMLKQLTWCYVIKNENRELETQQSGQIKMINRVFETLYERANDPSRLEIFPPRFEVQIRAAQGNLPLVTRLVCDYVSGMTEKEITTADSKYRK